MAKKTTPNALTFTAQQSVLNKALNIASKALSDNKVMPINEMFLFDINGNSLTIEACDMRLIISTQIEIQSSIENFKICIPGRKLQDYIAKSANELLVFEIEKYVTPEVRETKEHSISGEPYEVVTTEQISYSLLVKSGTNPNNKAKFSAELGEDFPKISNVYPQQFELPADDFLNMLNRIMFAISNDELRPSATGLNVRIEDGKITATGLNFEIVSTVTYPSNINIPTQDFIIPKKVLQQIQALSPSGFMSCEISKSALSISWDGIKTTALLIDAKYPDYLSITPTHNAIDFVTSRLELIASLKRILPFSDIGKMVRLEFSDMTKLTLRAENIDYAEEATETIGGALANGSDVLADTEIWPQPAIGVNGEYLLSILNSITACNEVWFSLDTPRTAMIITSGERHVNPGKENLILLMPLFIPQVI